MAWEKSQEIRSGKYTLWDHCFELPGKNLEAVKSTLDSVQAGTVSHKLKVAGNDKLELYDYPGGYAQRFDGIAPGGGDRAGDVQKIFQDNARTAGIRMQQETTPALLISGRSTCRQFTAGPQVHARPAFQRQRGLRPDPGSSHFATMGDAYVAGSGSPRDLREHVRVHPRRAALPAGTDDSAPDRGGDADGRRRRQLRARRSSPTSTAG